MLRGTIWPWAVNVPPRKRRHALVLALCATCMTACNEPAPAAPAAPAPPKAEPAFAATPAAVPADQPGSSQGMRAHLNLLNLAHLADVDQGGLFLDFGTPARMKYTIGQWKTGFGKDGSDNGVTYTRVGSTGRVYLPLAPMTAPRRRFAAAL